MSQYVIVIEHAGANYSAYAPDVPGCIATGDTAEDTVAMMREALAFHFEGMRNQGLPIPAPSVQTAVVEAAPTPPNPAVAE